ncbi:MAG: hypothetical protein WA029_20365 [Anaerolineae bacterium]
MSALAFMTERVAIWRNEDLGGGRTGEAAEYLTDVPMTRLWPVGQETISQLALNSPREFKECYHVSSSALPDIREGDILRTADDADYPIMAVNEWDDDDIATLHVVVQQVKGV